MIFTTRIPVEYAAFSFPPIARSAFPKGLWFVISRTKNKMIKNKIKGTAPPNPLVRNLANPRCTDPPGLGIKRRAVPSKIAVVAIVTIIGANFPFVTIPPLTAPQTSPITKDAIIEKITPE